MSAMLGLQTSGMAQVVDALQKNRANRYCGIISKNVLVAASHSYEPPTRS